LQRARAKPLESCGGSRIIKRRAEETDRHTTGLQVEVRHFAKRKAGVGRQDGQALSNIHAGRGRHYLKNLYEGAWVSSRSDQPNFVKLAA
jgi:hypothetical protein